MPQFLTNRRDKNIVPYSSREENLPMILNTDIAKNTKQFQSHTLVGVYQEGVQLCTMGGLWKVVELAWGGSVSNGPSRLGNRPGVAGAVLQTPSLLSVGHPFVQISSKQTGRARELIFWEKVHLPPATCHVACGMCHMSCVTCHIINLRKHFFLFLF